MYFVSDGTPLVIVLNTLSWSLYSLVYVIIVYALFMSSLCDSTPSVIVLLEISWWLHPVGDCTHLVTVLSLGDCTNLVIVLTW